MPRLLRSVARTAVVAGTATAVSNRVSRRQQGRWAAQEQPAAPQEQPVQAAPAAPAPAAPAPAAAGSMEDKIAQLNALGQLKSQGMLTEAEFEAQKRLILG